MGKMNNLVILAPKTRDNTKYKTVTPEKFRQAFSAAQGGRPAALYKIMDWFLSMDGHLAGALQSRISANTSGDSSLIIQDKTAKNENALEILKAALDGIKLRKLKTALLKANYYGARAVELIWAETRMNGKAIIAPVGFKNLPHDFIYADKIRKTDDYKSVFVGAEPLENYDRGHVLLFTAGDADDYSDPDFTTFGRGVSAMRYSIVKYFDVEDWAAFNEVFGMPMRLGILKTGAGEEALKRLEEAVHNLGNDASAVIDETTEIQFPEVNKYSSKAAYEALSEFCNREISKAITSEALTGGEGKTGTYGAMQTANGIRLDVAQSDAAELDDLIQENIINVFYEINFPGLEVPKMKTAIKAAPNLFQQSNIDKNLFEMGLPLSVSALRKRYDAPAPVDDEDRLEKTQNSLFG